MIAIRLLSRVEHNINYAPTTEAFESHRNAAPIHTGITVHSCRILNYSGGKLCNPLSAMSPAVI
jgi:hypothetical protein